MIMVNASVTLDGRVTFVTIQSVQTTAPPMECVTWTLICAPVQLTMEVGTVLYTSMCLSMLFCLFRWGLFCGP